MYAAECMNERENRKRVCLALNGRGIEVNENGKPAERAMINKCLPPVQTHNLI
jgi:hypothetical protein